MESEADLPGAPGTDRREFGTFGLATGLVTTRQNIAPRRLVDPGPTAAELDALLSMAAAAPDHGMLTPWRFIGVPVPQRHRLADAFVQALLERHPAATADQVESAREKAYRAPMLLIAVACLEPREPDVPAFERLVSMGAAIQNILLGAHAMGYGAGLTSGQAMSSLPLRALCRLSAGEAAVCCINIGTVSKHKGRARARPGPADIHSVLGTDPAMRDLT